MAALEAASMDATVVVAVERVSAYCPASGPAAAGTAVAMRSLAIVSHTLAAAKM